MLWPISWMPVLHTPVEKPVEALNVIWMAGVVEELINSLDESAPHLVEYRSILRRHEVTIIPGVERSVFSMELLANQCTWPITLATIARDFITESSSANLIESLPIRWSPELHSAIDVERPLQHKSLKAWRMHKSIHIKNIISTNIDLGLDDILGIRLDKLLLGLDGAI